MDVSEKLKELSAKLSSVARKKSLKGADLDVIRDIREQLLQVISQAKECDICSTVVAGLIKVEIDNVRAAVCQDCGLKLMKSPKLIHKKSAGRHALEKKAPAHAVKTVPDKAEMHHKPRHKKTHGEADSSAGKPHRAAARIGSFVQRAQAETEQAEARKKSPQIALSFEESRETAVGEVDFDGLARKNHVTIGVLRKIHKMISSVAFPMSPEGTLQFVKSELTGENIKIGDSELRIILSDLRKSEPAGNG